MDFLRSILEVFCGLFLPILRPNLNHLYGIISDSIAAELTGIIKESSLFFEVISLVVQGYFYINTEPYSKISLRKPSFLFLSTNL